MKKTVNENHATGAKNQIYFSTKVSLAQNRHAQYLPQQIRERAIEIPKDGYKATTKNGEIFNVMPCVQLEKMGRIEYNRLGTYNISEDIVIILANDSKTYLMHKCQNIVGIMEKIGYKRDYRLMVPISKSDRFIDPKVQEKFELENL